MGTSRFSKVVLAIQELSRAELAAVRRWLKKRQELEVVDEIAERRLQTVSLCPRCGSPKLVRNGWAHGLQRYKCRCCLRTCNSLTGTPLARLHYRERWLTQAQLLVDGASITTAADRLDVARSTAFRWRHRFLALPQACKDNNLMGIVEADETCMLKSCKGQKAKLRSQRRPSRTRGGHARRRGMSEEHDIVLVVHDRMGGCTDSIVSELDAAHLAAVLRPAVAADALLCTDGSAALAAAARAIGVDHQAINVSAGQYVRGPWHVNNVNGYHSRLKRWLRRFHGVASSYLPNYLGWFRALDRQRTKRSLEPQALLALAVGI